MYNCVSAFIVEWIFFILAGNENNHKNLDEFEFWPDLTADGRVNCPWASEKTNIVLHWEKCCGHSSAFIFGWIFFILAVTMDNHKILYEFEFPPDSTTNYRAVIYIMDKINHCIELVVLECLKNQCLHFFGCF